jgi:hypothetical protein
MDVDSRSPARIGIAEPGTPLIGVFFRRLEHDRGDSVVRWVRGVTFAENPALLDHRSCPRSFTCNWTATFTDEWCGTDH